MVPPSNRLAASALLLMLVGAPACESPVAEPEPAAPRRPASDKPASIAWTVPPTWTTARTADKGEYRGKYQIPKSGDSKHQPEMLVTYLGKGKAVAGERLARFRRDFVGPDIAAQQLETIRAGAISSQVLELAGTYRFPLGPQLGKQKRAAATVMKKDWRGLGAAVTTAKRGSYFFQLVGPNDAVEAARDDFRKMIGTLK